MEHIRDTAAPTRYRGSENGMTVCWRWTERALSGSRRRDKWLDQPASD